MICVIQYEDRPGFEKHMNAINEYCRKNNYVYKGFTDKIYNLPPYWVKVFLIRKFLEEYDYIIWVDSDVVVNKKCTLKFEDIVAQYPDASFIGAGDPPFFSSARFMAGVFIVKNTPIGKSIINAWLEQYRPERWSYDGTWHCPGKWAGDDYEQGSFMTFIYPRYLLHIVLLDHYYFHEININEPHRDAITFHFAGTLKHLLHSFKQD
jgi:hypothetical protein